MEEEVKLILRRRAYKCWARIVKCIIITLQIRE